MIKRLVFLTLLCVGLAGMTGCSKTYHIQIQSDTCWNGYVNGEQNIQECGNSNYKVLGKFSCVQVQKLTVEGYLRVRVDGGPWAETTASHGTVQVCK